MFYKSKNTTIKFFSYCIFLWLIINTKDSHAQNYFDFNSSPVSQANASTLTKESPFSGLNNPATLAEIRDIYLVAGTKIHHELIALSESYLSINYPTKVGVMNLNFYRYGSNSYNEQTISVGYANKIDKISIGGRINYLQTRQSSKRSLHNLTFKLHGIIHFNKRLLLGTSISNIFGSKVKTEFSEDEPLPILMELGLSYYLFKNLNLGVQIKSNTLEKDLKVSGGIGFNFLENVYASTGFETNPFKSIYGLGIILTKKIGVEYSISFHHTLGSTHHFTAYYKIPKR